MAQEPFATAIAGAAGRMGKTLIAMLAEQTELRLCAALEHPKHPHLGRDSGELAGVAANGTPLQTAEQSGAFDVLIDFSGADAALSNLRLCREQRCALVLGSTGWGEEVRRELQAAAAEIPIVCAPNMSAEVNVFMRMIKMVAETVGEEAGVEIIDIHHRHKKDAPSGTALRIGEMIAAVRGRTLEECAVYGRSGADVARRPGEIGFSSLRVGNLAGEHTVRFTSDTDELVFTHRALNRGGFAAGALRAALWLRGRAAGLYDMEAVLGL